jgi:hypothetical protein
MRVSTEAAWSPGVGSVLVVAMLTAWVRPAPSTVPARTTVKARLAPAGTSGSAQRTVAPGVQELAPSTRTNRAPAGIASLRVSPAAALGPWLTTVTT